MREFDLEWIKQVIVQHYVWGSISSWTNFHFRELSRAIEETTGDRISEETLKRIFGKRKVASETYQPQAFSQMALMKFAEHIEKIEKNEKANNKQKRKLYRIAGWGFGLGAAIGLWFLFVNPLKISKEANFDFSCENPVDYYPYTATFLYNISEIEDSVFTDFGRGQETFLPPERSKINYFYSNTGVYNVQFYTRSHVLDSLKVTAYSDDWQGGYFPNLEPDEFQPFTDQNVFKQVDFFYTPPDEFKKDGTDLTQGYWTTYRFFSPFGQSLDSLMLKTRLLNNASTGSMLCYDIEISLIGESGNIVFKFTQLKCSRYANLRLSEKTLDGKFDNLSALTVDLSDWLQIKMVTENHNFNLYLSDTLIFSGEYKKPLGNLVGVVYSFYGTGKIDYLHLQNLDSGTFYENEFASKKGN